MTILTSNARKHCAVMEKILCGHNFSVSHTAEHFQRFLLALFLFAADIGDTVIHHFGPALKCFSGAGNGLIGAYQHLLHAVLQQGSQSGDIALNRAVGLHCDKAFFVPSRCLCAAITLMWFALISGTTSGTSSVSGGRCYWTPQGLPVWRTVPPGHGSYLFPCSRRRKQNPPDRPVFLRLYSVQHHEGLGLFGNFCFHGPAAGYGPLRTFSGASGTGGYGGQFEPGCWSRSVTKRWPTMPVPPIIPTRYFSMLYSSHKSRQRTVLLQEKE